MESSCAKNALPFIKLVNFWTSSHNKCVKGSEDKKILDRGHNLLSVHGIGKDQPREFWKFFFIQLLTFGHVIVNFHDI